MKARPGVRVPAACESAFRGPRCCHQGRYDGTSGTSVSFWTGVILSIRRAINGSRQLPAFPASRDKAHAEDEWVRVLLLIHDTDPGQLHFRQQKSAWILRCASFIFVSHLKWNASDPTAIMSAVFRLASTSVLTGKRVFSTVVFQSCICSLPFTRNQFESNYWKNIPPKKPLG